MKKVQITQAQKRQIAKIAKQIRLRYAEIDMYGERGDYFYLYYDIIQELNKKNKDKIVKFYELVELMREADNLFKPENAFLSGLQAKATGKEYQVGLMDYFEQINGELYNAELPTQKQEIFQELCNVLDEAQGLMTEFIENYTKYTSTEVYFIDEFFKYGYGMNEKQNDAS